MDRQLTVYSNGEIFSEIRLDYFDQLSGAVTGELNVVEKVEGLDMYIRRPLGVLKSAPFAHAEFTTIDQMKHFDRELLARYYAAYETKMPEGLVFEYKGQLDNRYAIGNPIEGIAMTSVDFEKQHKTLQFLSCLKDKADHVAVMNGTACNQVFIRKQLGIDRAFPITVIR